MTEGPSELQPIARSWLKSHVVILETAVKIYAVIHVCAMVLSIRSPVQHNARTPPASGGHR